MLSRAIALPDYFLLNKSLFQSLILKSSLKDYFILLTLLFSPSLLPKKLSLNMVWMAFMYKFP